MSFIQALGALGPNPWPVLLSGAVGALVSAFVGGVVALGVVLLANRAQRTIAAKSLQEQMSEASRVRENAAIAQIVTVAPRFRDAPSQEDRFELISRMESALVIWEFERPGDPIFAELIFWPQLLFTGAKALFAGGDDRAGSMARMSQLIHAITANLKRWPSSDAVGRSEIVAKLEAARTSSGLGPKAIIFMSAP